MTLTGMFQIKADSPSLTIVEKNEVKVHVTIFKMLM
jgi:hypothetical protein